MPGFIDSHVHLIGGGGEGGFATRTPEISIQSIVESGITTVVGCLGTDSVCRDMKALIAKARALEEQGITTYCYTGAYDFPVKTIIGTIKEDIMLVDKIIGVGEIALSDHRSSQPTYDEFVRVVSESRVGGLLSKKSGVVNIHLGDGKKQLEYLFKLLNDTEIPSTQMLPTHINRSKTLLDEGIKYAKNNGYVDLTTSNDPKHLEPEEMRASDALLYLLKNNVEIEHITFSSDGNGSMPIFNDDGKLQGMGICSVSSLYREVKDSVEKGLDITTAIKTITSNVSNLLGLFNKGIIEKGKDADLVLVNEENLNINKVIAKGKLVVDNGKSIIHETFIK